MAENYEKESIKNSNKFNKTYILYIIAICLYAFGFINYPLIETHIANLNIISTTYIPLLYALAMFIDAFSALIFGTLYDKYGFVTLVISTLLSTTFSLFVFTSNNIALIIIGVILWGIGMGAQESIMKAGIASLTSKENRSKGYGVFQIFFGASMLVGGSLAGFLHDNSISLMIIVSILFQFLSVIIFIITDLSNKKRIKMLQSLSSNTDINIENNTINSDITQQVENSQNQKDDTENNLE